VEPQEEKSEEYTVGDLYVSAPRHLVTVRGDPVVLTLKEFEVLIYLLRNPGIVLTRDQIMTGVWGYDFDGESRTVDVHIRTLRAKLGACADLIETVRGVGYRIGGTP
jgi:two-component system alkaline phosphatase synthesis response regulator PhoP